VFAYLHVQAVRQLGYYVWPGLLLWGLDRSARVFRIAFFNRIFRLKSGSAQATVELLSEDTIRLNLRRPVCWSAGQHAYLTLPGVSTIPFEAHPFTISTIPNPPKKKKDDLSNGDKELSFIIRGRNGFTGLLRNHAANGANAGTPVLALFDGPYGAPPDLSVYSTCVLISGGSGVSYTLPLLLDLIQQARTSTALVEKVVFIWAIRSESHIAWISSQLAEALDAAPSSLLIEIRIFVTQSSVPRLRTLPETDEKTLSRKESKVSVMEMPVPQELATNEAVRFEFCRPPIAQLLGEIIEYSSGPVSVDVSGPQKLIDTVRTTLRTGVASPAGILRGSASVSLHVETFGM